MIHFYVDKTILVIDRNVFEDIDLIFSSLRTLSLLRIKVYHNCK